MSLSFSHVSNPVIASWICFDRLRLNSSSCLCLCMCGRLALLASFGLLGARVYCGGQCLDSCSYFWLGKERVFRSPRFALLVQRRCIIVFHVYIHVGTYVCAAGGFPRLLRFILLFGYRVAFAQGWHQSTEHSIWALQCFTINPAMHTFRQFFIRLWAD